MNKFASIIITIGLLVGIGIIFWGQSRSNSSSVSTLPSNIEVREGVQYITINARGGYSPRTTEAQAGIPTKLIVETSNTYDCSLALVIKSVGFRKILSTTGKETIDLGTPQEGKLKGLCSMGMYSFAINFK